MKVISTIIDMILYAILIAVLCFGTYKLATSYYGAKEFAQLNAAEKAIMRVTDTGTYFDLENNYEFISCIPLLGDTL